VKINSQNSGSSFNLKIISGKFAKSDRLENNKTIYIHIGPHKTGTTTIQHALFSNEDRLLQAGILCPKSGRSFPSSAAIHNLGFESLSYKRKFDPKYGTWKDLRKEIDHSEGIQKVILSSEVLSVLDLNKIKYIKKILKNYNFKIVAYLRRQDEAIQSTWVEHVRNAGQKPIIDSFYDWLEKFNYSFGNTDYLNIVSKWERVFSKENIILRIFDPPHFSGSLFNDFLLLCDENILDLKKVPNLNVSPGVKTIEATRLIKNNLNLEMITDQLWNYIAGKIVGFGNEKGWNLEKVNYLDKALSEKIMSHYQDSNRIIADRYFSQERLFSLTNLGEKPTHNFIYDDFLKSEILELYSYVLEQASAYKMA